MTAARERLANRRASETFAFECNGLSYLATISRYPDNRLAEIFISNAKAGSHSDSAAKDSAVVCSTRSSCRIEHPNTSISTILMTGA
jgi:hypothetical protein